MKSMADVERDREIRKLLRQGVHPQAPLVDDRPFG
jgi:hypothetical protein